MEFIKKYLGIIVIGILIIAVSITFSVKAAQNSKIKDLIELAGVVNETNKDVLLGAINSLNDTIFGGTTNYDSLELSENLTVTGTSNFTGSRTMPFNIIGPVHIDISQTATSSAANPPVAGYLINTGSPKICTAPELYLSSGNGLFGSNWAVGTTTCSVAGATCGDGVTSFVSTSTATLIASHAVTTSTIRAIGKAIVNNGSYYINDDTVAEPWVWETGVALVAYSDRSGATSSDSYIAGGGFTDPVGKLTTWCWDTY